jgi:hypothetical protein
MIDYAMVTGKFYALPKWAGSDVNEFFASYYVPVSSTELQLANLYYPAYYRSTVARLYNFDGEEKVPSADCALAISWEWKTGQELIDRGYSYIIYPGYGKVPIQRGAHYNVVVDYRFFSSYEEAEAYDASQSSGNYDAGGFNPFVTIVPLEELSSYKLVYSSGDTTSSTTVKVFEYLGSGEP